eukprot:8192686-Pyramimonas_sp.AAC.1
MIETAPARDVEYRVLAAMRGVGGTWDRALWIFCLSDCSEITQRFHWALVGVSKIPRGFSWMLFDSLEIHRNPCGVPQEFLNES